MGRDVGSSVTVFGAGYVGLVTGACLASSGHSVTVVEIDAAKLDRLVAGEVPLHEPGLLDVIREPVAAGRLRFAHASRIDTYGEFVFIAVGTPSTAEGAADLRFVKAVVDQVAIEAPAGTVVVMKSTVPPGTGAQMSAVLAPAGIAYVSNPEFLREGSAVDDWFHADRIVLGGEPADVRRVEALYSDLDAPRLSCDIASAELIKYASNAFLATKISYANEIARLCDCVEADVTVVLDGVGMDRRIGTAFLNAGIGYGGSCFPKDTRALDFLSGLNGCDFQLLKAVIDVNARQRLLPVEELRRRLGELSGLGIAVLGLTFKPDTDDTREAPATEIIAALLADGADVRVYDPVGRLETPVAGCVQTATIEDAVRDTSAAIIATEWTEIKDADWSALVSAMTAPRIVFDGRNCIDGDTVRAAAGTYVGVGRR
jgi:UDPglucose 6-dehydrogenase